MFSCLFKVTFVFSRPVLTDAENDGFAQGYAFEQVEQYHEAHMWYSKAAEGGNPNAMYRLGRLYRLGLGVDSKNHAIAAKWYSSAFHKGVEEANPFRWYRQVEGVRCLSGADTFPVDRRPAAGSDVYRSFENYAAARQSMEMETLATVKEAVIWCEQHWSCFGFSYYNGPNQERHMLYGWRPRFCTQPIASNLELAADEDWVTVLRLNETTETPLLSQQPPKPPQSMPRCSFAGKLQRCFSPGTCRRFNFEPHTRAFVLSHDLAQPLELNEPYLRWLKNWAGLRGIDVVFLVPQKNLASFPLGKEDSKFLMAIEVRIIEVDWVMPEFAKLVNKYVKTAWCASRDFFKLHAFGLEEYEAVVYYDMDVLPVGDDIEVLFSCARQGFLVMTALHGGFEPLHAAFFAVRPQKQLLRAILMHLRETATFNGADGWDGLGYGPWGCTSFNELHCFTSSHIGADCAQGLLYNLFYNANNNFMMAMAKEGVVPPLSVMIDGCYWLYENVDFVKGYFPAPFPCSDVDDCDGVRAFHGTQLRSGCASDDALSTEVLGVLLRRATLDSNSP